MVGKKNKTRSSTIGRRTGVNVLQGKSVRRQEDGIDMFEDYWTDSDSVRSDQTSVSNYSIKNKSQLVSENVTNQDSGAVSPVKPLRSSLKRAVNNKLGEYGGGSISGVPGRKSITFSEDVENATFARSKMTQTSYMLDETTSSPAKNRSHLREIRTNEDGLSGSENNSAVRKSPRKLPNTFPQNRMEDLSTSKDDGNPKGVREKKSGKKDANNSNSRANSTSLSINTTRVRESYLTEIRRKEVSSSDSEENSSVRRSPRKLSNTFAVPIIEDLPLSKDDKNTAGVHENKSGKKAVNKSKSKVDSTSPSKNTSTRISYSTEIRRNEVSSTVNEGYTNVRRSPRKSSDILAPAHNSLEDLPFSTDDANHALSHENASGKKTKNKSNTNEVESEVSSSKNRTYTQPSSLKETALKKRDSSYSERNSTVRRSSGSLSKTFAQNNMKNLHLSTNDASSSEIASGKNKSNSRIAIAGGLPNKNKTYTQISPLKETGLRKIDSSQSERNSTLKRSVRSLSNTLVQNNMEDLPSSTDDVNVASSHEIAPVKKTKTKSNSSVARTDNSPSEERTNMQISPLEETESKKSDSFCSERNSPVKKSPTVLLHRLNLLISEEKDKGRNSSEGRSPERETRSDVQNNKEKSLNRPETAVSHERECERRDDGQISTIEKSPTVLLHRLNLLINEEKDKGRNSSGGISPERETRSDVQNNKEKSISRSKTAVSHERESVRREDGQKSSIEKSPVSVKRKLQTSKALESSLPKSPRVQNRGNESNKRNSLGDRSSLHKVKASALLNQEESIPSGSDKSIPSGSDKSIPSGSDKSIPSGSDKSIPSGSDKSISSGSDKSMPSRSDKSMPSGSDKNKPSSRDKSMSSGSDKGINISEVESSSKENGQKSSSKSSHRVSDHNVKHVSNSTDSHMTADKSMHSAKRKIDFSEVQKSTSKGKKPASDNIRKSSRNRFPCLASWRNERPKFANTSTGEIKFLGIDKGQPEDDFAYRKLKKRYERKVQKPKLPGKKINIRKTAIANVVNGKKIKLNLHRPFNTCEWIKPQNDENAGYMVSKVFASQLLAFGFLDIDAHSVKDKQYSPTDNVYFVVVKGVIDAVIDETSFTFKSGDSFIVPVGNAYSISNNTSSSALLNFCSFKMPFFKYQENMLD